MVARLRDAGAQQIVEMHDPDGSLHLDDDKGGDLRRIEQLQRLANELIGPHGLRRRGHDLLDWSL